MWPSALNEHSRGTSWLTVEWSRPKHHFAELAAVLFSKHFGDLLLASVESISHRGVTRVPTMLAHLATTVADAILFVALTAD